MNIQIFYSWQTDTDAKYNNYLIQKALKAAIERLEKKKADSRFKPMLDRAGDPKQAGSPNVVTSINKKIRTCDIFVADVTYVTQYQTVAKGKAKKRTKGAINSNVAIELGQAKSLLGDERIIKVLNNAHGSPVTGVELPFDIEQDRHPFEFTATNTKDAKVASNDLEEFLYLAIDNILREHETLQKEKFKPLLTIGKWSELVAQKAKYTTNSELESLTKLLQEQINTAKSVVRVSGLSGIGKSRFVFEALTPVSAAVLYYDAASQADNNISEKISELTAEGESFIFVIDNVPPELHERLSKIIVRNSSTSSLVTIVSEAEDNVVGAPTVHIQINSRLGKQVAFAILQERFGSQDYFTLQQAIEAVGGLPSLAVSLTQQPELDVHALTQVTSTNWVNAVLGQQAKNGNNRSVLRALAVFGIVGYEDELAQQAKLLAEDDLITPLNGISEKQRWSRFQQIVRTYFSKGIISQRGRYITIQPQHLAFQLAREWWEEQGIEVTTVLELVQGTPLAVGMFEQLRQLSRLPLAQELVNTLCQMGGPVGQADVILTEEGSHFLQSLADVNPEAVVSCLARELLPLSHIQLREATGSRRSLVNALDKLCRYKSTFDRAARVLLHLATAENEHILNNASGQFRQLYQFKLSGTEADYTARVNTLFYGVKRNDLQFDRVVIAACATALNPDGVSRMIVGPEQLQPWQEFEPRTYHEIWTYWQQTVEILNGYAVNTSHPQQGEAAEILIRSLPRLVPFGGAHTLLSVIETLVNNKQISFKQVHSTVDSVLHFKWQHVQEIDLNRLKQLLLQTEPVTLEDKLERYVFDFATSAEHERMDEQALEQRAQSLVPEFLSRPDLWQTTSFNVYGKNPFYTYKFYNAVAVALVSSPEKINEILEYLLDGLRQDSSGKYSVGNALTGFLNGGGPSLSEKTLRQVMADPKLRHLTFLLAGQITDSSAILEELLDAVERGDFPVDSFDQLRYSRILSDLTIQDFEQIAKRIAAVNTSGRWVALSLIWNRSEDDERKYWWPLIKELILTKDLWSISVDSLLETRALQALTRMLEEVTDSGTVEACTHQIIRYVDSSEVWRMSGDAYLPLRTLLQKHFNVAWPLIGNALLKEEVSGLYVQIGSSTGSRPTDGEQYQEQGLLFEFGDYDQIINWCHEQQLFVLRRFANILPVFDQNKHNVWHTFTHRFIDEFGQDESLLREIQARMNTWGASGSVESMYQAHLTLFKQLINHPVPTVQVWALRQIDRLPLIAKGERTFVEELYLNR